MEAVFPEIQKRFGFGMMRLPMVGDLVDIPQTTLGDRPYAITVLERINSLAPCPERSPRLYAA